MNPRFRLLFALAALVFATSPLGGCCGFDCNDDDDKGPGFLNLGLSDSLPEELTQVVLEIDQIILRRSRSDDVQVNTFTIPELDITDAESFQIDLLDYQGVRQLQVITGLELAVGSYNEVFLRVLDTDSNNSFVQETVSGEIKPLTVSGDGLTLSGVDIDIDEGSTSSYIVEFGLPRALTYSNSNDSYSLSTEGLRLADPGSDARLVGDIESSLFDTVSPCDEKTEPTSGNRVYLYQGRNLRERTLADVHTTASGNDIPEQAVAPFAVATLSFDDFNGNWRYSFGYLPPGDYTLAFACDTAGDDAVNFDNLTIALPEDQVYELTLSEGTETRCDLTLEPSC